MPRKSNTPPYSYKASNPYSSIVMPKFQSPLGPTFYTSRPYSSSEIIRPSLFNSIKEGFGFGVGTSIARNIFESKPPQRLDETSSLHPQTQTLTPGNPPPQLPPPHFPPPLSPSQNVSRQQNSIQQNSNSKNESSISCSELEDLYTQCLVKEHTIDECSSLQEKLNTCLGKKK